MLHSNTGHVNSAFALQKGKNAVRLRTARLRRDAVASNW